MMDTFSPPVAPSYGSSVKIKNRVLVAQLGDAYTVRAGDGLNTKVRTWSVQWSALALTDADTIETFLTTQAGYKAFLWTPPRGPQGKWICLSWDRTPAGPDNDDLNAEFEEVFDL